jgi:hypothetical protein
MSRSALDLLLAAVIVLVLLLKAPDILVFGVGLAWWVARRSSRVELGQVARAAMFGGVAVRVAIALAFLAAPALFGVSSPLGWWDVARYSPEMTGFTIATLGLLTLIEAFALGCAVRLLVPRLS